MGFLSDLDTKEIHASWTSNNVYSTIYHMRQTENRKSAFIRDLEKTR